ncbi:helix-turn-helix domain-containing protein, partial [Pseudomonas juntendi]|uniref:helix-turn-helix domain-containing protein n=1 Tax=Pseudomonas juntendi TaxID=2666183 RepID=UPI001E5B6427
MSTHVLAAVLTRLKLLTGAQSDADLSRALSVSPQTLSSWKVRDSIPYSLCIEIARQHACSLDWLLLGHGEQGPAPPGRHPPRPRAPAAAHPVIQAIAGKHGVLPSQVALKWL